MVPSLLRHVSRSAFTALIALPLLVGCEAATAPAPRVAALIIAGAADSIVIGGTRQLAATATSSSGSTISGAPVLWTTSVPTVASVSAGGLVTAHGAGSTIITATSGTAVHAVAMHVRYPDCAASAQAALTIGGTRDGSLGGSGSCLIYGHYRAIGYPVTLPADGGARFTVSATGFEPMLFLANAAGLILDGAYSADGSTATLRVTPGAGAYQVFVASAGPPAATNSFVVTSAATAGQCTAAVTPTIAVGGEATVAVGDASCVLLGGPAVAGWRLTLATPQRLRFAATATAFAPVVAITNLAMEVLDAGLQFFPGTAEVARMMPAGEYLVWGGVLGAGSGNVTVSVEEAVPCTAAGVLPLPGSVNGALEVTDCPMEGYSSAFGDPWTLTLGAATTVEFNLTSATFDTYLELRTADDEYIASDDDGGTGTNSRLVRTLPAGTYRVWATSFYSSVTGSYTLSAAVTGGGLLAPPEGTSAPSAKPGRPPRSVPWPAPRADGTRRRE
jgi:trimeric autotransporter adhesin